MAIDSGRGKGGYAKERLGGYANRGGLHFVPYSVIIINVHVWQVSLRNCSPS